MGIQIRGPSGFSNANGYVRFGGVWVPFNSVGFPGETLPPEPPVPGDNVSFTLTEDTTGEFISPERGWMFNYASIGQIAGARAAGGPVIWPSLYDSTHGVNNPFRLDQQRNGAPIPASKITQLHAWFNAVRAASCHAKVRFSYHGNPTTYNGDASISTVLSHLAQLEPVIQDHLDVITSMDFGLVGRWGEWNQSTNGFNADSSAGRALRAQLIEGVLNVLGPERMASIRYPLWAYEWLGNTFDLPGGAVPFDGSLEARLGWYNDCIVSNSSDGGTYRGSWAGAGAFQQDLDTFEAIGDRAVTSGETCSAYGAPNASSAGANAINHFTLLGGPDHLNRSYFAGIINDWYATGHGPEIARRLGYRIFIEEGSASPVLTRGAQANITVTWRNRGFGKVYNRRPWDLALRPTGGGTTRVIRLTQDARNSFPLAGQQKTVSFNFTVPADMAPGTYALDFGFPDADIRGRGMDENPLYSLRLANQGTWHAETGRNRLGITRPVV